MKKKLFVFLLVVALVTSISGTALATTKASDFLAGYGISIEAQGDGLMEIFYNVDGTSRMTKIGAQALYVDCYKNGYWQPYTTLLEIDNPDFYGYDIFGHAGFAYFTGEPGVKYRVTLKAYAKNADGYDTGLATSQSATCY